MKRFRNILVVFDGHADNRSLLSHVLDLAKRNQASVTAVDIIEERVSGRVKPIDREQTNREGEQEINIIEEFPFEASIPSPFVSSNETEKGLGSKTEELTVDIQEYIIQEELRNFQQFVYAIRQAGIPVNSKTLYGIRFIEIIRQVLRSQHDLVMTTAEAGGDGKELWFGSTTMHLMRKCPCPVWVIKPGQSKPYGRVLAAVDLVQEDETRAALNTKIIELASSLARLGQSELLIVHAWRMVGESLVRQRGGFSTDQVDRLLREAKEAQRQQLVELIRKHPLEDVKHEVYLLKGEAGTLIPELAQAKAVELIVMGTVGRAGVAGLLIGNTAEKVLRQVDCSMLTVKPEGFVTPVKLESA